MVILVIAVMLLSFSFLEFAFTQMGDALGQIQDGNLTYEDNSGEVSVIPMEELTFLEGEEELQSSGDEPVPLKDPILSKVIGDPRSMGLLYAQLFLVIALSLIPDLFPWIRSDRAGHIAVLANAVLYLACGIPFLILGYVGAAVVIMNILYSVALVGESAIIIKRRRGKGRIVGRSLLLILLVANLLLFSRFSLFILLVIALRAFRKIILIAFSQVRVDVLKKIIRKTYAAEILFGMVLLMAACSILLSIVDPGINSFWDALWFCFATVTTIGYGDITTTSMVGRIMSVILGVYGIIVVALITSIIVNFYNETKEEKNPEKGDEETR